MLNNNYNNINVQYIMFINKATFKIFIFSLRNINYIQINTSKYYDI